MNNEYSKEELLFHSFDVAGRIIFLIIILLAFFKDEPCVVYVMIPIGVLLELLLANYTSKNTKYYTHPSKAVTTYLGGILMLALIVSVAIDFLSKG